MYKRNFKNRKRVETLTRKKRSIDHPQNGSRLSFQISVNAICWRKY